MNKTNIFVALTFLIIGSACGYTAAKQSNQKPLADAPMGMHRMPDGTMMSDADDSAEEMNHMAAMMVSSEREFIEGMIPHHQEAVDTAQEVIARGGTTPEIATLVKGIVVAQEMEIAEMKQWYQDWYGEAYSDAGAYMPMMRELENLSGVDIDRVFLEDMIGHHMGAIMMAQSVQPHIERDEIAGLTQAIVTTQSAEIAQMRLMLRSL